MLTECLRGTPEKEKEAKKAIPGVVLGEEGLLAVATYPDVDIVVAATSGLMGLTPTLAAIKAGKTIALANKETLVIAGHLVMAAELSAGVSLLPMVSEPSHHWRFYHGSNTTTLPRIIPHAIARHH